MSYNSMTFCIVIELYKYYNKAAMSLRVITDYIFLDKLAYVQIQVFRRKTTKTVKK